MIRIKDSGRCENIINNIEVSTQRIEEILRETSTLLKKVDDTDTWTGLAQKEFSNKNRELESNYSAINNSLRTYVGFARQVIEDYKEVEGQTNRNIETNSVQLDVNS